MPCRSYTRLLRHALGLAAALLLGACVSEDIAAVSVATDRHDDSLLGSAGAALTGGRPENASLSSSGQFANQPIRGFVAYGRPSSPVQDDAAGVAPAGPGTYSLNFVDVDIQDFVRSVFDEILHENVVIDPTLSGHITVRTNQPVNKAVARALVQDALRASGATVAQNGQVWQVASATQQGAHVQRTVKVIPLRFIDANSARMALQPFNATGNASIMVGGSGRFLICAGSSSDIDMVEQVVATLDIDELGGRSFALLPLKEASAATVSQEVGQMLSTAGATATKIISVDRMNAVLIMASDRSVIARAQALIARLDRSGQDQRRLFVYPVRNRRAVELAKVLEGLITKRSEPEQGASAEAAVAPGLTPQQVSSPSPANPKNEEVAQTSPYGALVPVRSTNTPPIVDDSVEIRADPGTNSIVVMCRQERYRSVEATIRSLDVLPAQVLIEVTIAEVQLNAALSHGVRWFFQAGHHAFGTASDAQSSNLLYSFGLPRAQIALEALESVTHVDIVSSPALTVMDNETASLKVGDEVPIATRSSQSTLNADAPIVNDITLKDTGIILQVTPRVNSNGLVMLDIDQEDSDVVPTTTSAINSPTIRQRKVTSSIAVQSGAEIVLGGIISHTNSTDKSGFPIVSEIPVIGSLLASNVDISKQRTELLVILRPTVMANQAEVAAVTNEIKAKLNRW